MGLALSAAEKKRLVEKKKRDKQARKVPRSAQQTIPYVEMCKDGICKVNSHLYTKTIRFSDINYQLAQNDDKTAIFENWCDFLNYFDSSIFVQLSFINQRASLNEFKKAINIPQQEDDFNDIRTEYSDMLQNQLVKGNNGLIKRKYITFGIEADSIKSAKPKLDRIEIDILNNFKTLGVETEPLTGYERLRVLHDVFNMDSNEPFRFSFDMTARTGLSSKDFIAPTSFDFREGKVFKMGRTIGAVSFLQILAPELNDRMLADFLDMDSNITVNLHIKTLDQAQAIKQIKSKITDLDKMKIEEQKKAVRSGYDMDIIPSDLATYGGEAKRLLQDLQTRNERMFLVTIILMNTSNNRQKLENNIFQTASIAQKYNCALKRLDFQQEAGLMSSLPIGINQIEIQRGLTTSSTAVFVPFTTQEIFQRGEALYYGLNALSNNMIMVDRKLLKNPNGLILGTPGSGKSFSAKREMTNAFLLTNDDIIVCDPEAEYFPLVHKLGGQVIRISPISMDYINPLDINLNYSEEESPLTLKSDFILSLCELIVGGKNGLEPVEKTLIDRSVRLVYQDFLADPVPEKMPVLEDLYNILLRQNEPEAKRIATALEIYVHGSLNVFNHRTNVDVQNRLVCYDIKELGKQLKKLGMLVVQDQVWNRVTVNRAQHKATRYYMDEFHLLLKEEQTAAYSVEIWKRFRKWGGIPTGITQNVKDLLASREIENIFENSDFIYMLNQASGDRQILSKALNISPSQLNYVTNSNAGEGLIFYGSTIIPFKDDFPKDTMLYRIMTTKPEEML
ncbi:VirB4-like conjugal transfer ATPase, CD1110 family [Caproiciproducens sp. R2]|uniref:VirB4-like conjugal transfer ATPase, CD1110 family n=1 Tax=Caproiciproducens sp. R2 TaxID=3435187 RepID=UPI0040345F16